MATDPSADVVRAAAYAAGRLGMKGAGVAAESREMIEKVGYEKTLELAQKEKGDAGQGKEIFARVGCVGCHTVTASEPPKGPYLGGSPSGTAGRS
jgi:mono/diheme cytochrome c family protein